MKYSTCNMKAVLNTGAHTNYSKIKN